MLVLVFNFRKNYRVNLVFPFHDVFLYFIFLLLINYAYAYAMESHLTFLKYDSSLDLFYNYNN